MNTLTTNETKSPKLSSKKKERINYFSPFYGEDATEVVDLLSSKGENSFVAIQKKLNSILHASYRDKEYMDALYSAFEILIEYTPDDIIQEVSQVRSSLGLEPYPNVKSSSLGDFMSLFITERIIDEKRRLLAYKPVFRIKPE